MSATRSRRDAGRIALTYAVLALLWIVGTDLLARFWVVDPELETWVETAKGAVFALATGGLLFVWTRKELSSRDEALRNYRTLAEHVPDLIFRLRLRPELEFEYVSPASVDLAGFTPEEHYDELDRVLEAVHPDDRKKLQTLLADPDAIDRSLELRWRHKDGDTVWVEFRIRRHRDADGHVHTVEGVARDITARKRAEEEKALLATAVEAAGEAVLVTDADGVIQYVNPAFTEITGYGPEEAIGRTPRLLKSGRQDDDFYAELWETITAGRMFRGEMVNRRKDGTFYDQEATITPVSDDAGEITNFVAVARDVTVRKEMDRRLRHAYKMEAIGQMAAGISHDFRNLLNVIQVNAEFLREAWEADPGADPDGTRKQVDEIQQAARRGAELVGKLLTLSKRKELELRPVDLGVVVREMEDAVRALLPESVSLRVVAEEGIGMRADRASLEQILLNLATNAAQAMRDGGGLSIELDGVRRRAGSGAEAPRSERDGDFARLVVEDTGVGMDEETLARVFDPFFTTKADGTGLGLAMVQSLVEQHGGFVQAESRPGRGTTFRLFFPRSEASLEAEPGDQAPEESVRTGPPGGSETVLIVEDQHALRDAAERALTRLGYSVLTASNGREALRMTEDAGGSVNLVITDLVMPEMGGDELFDALRARGFDAPVVFMSGYGPEETSAPRNPDRSRVFLQKPWTIEDLAWTVREGLDSVA